MAQYNYDAFGNTTASGAAAGLNAYRFSTKEQIQGLYYYGYRFYSPGMGKWINRDPIEEAGGINIYAFVGNSPLNIIDPDGRFILNIAAAVIGAGTNLAAYLAVGYFTGDINLAGAVGAVVGGFAAGLLGPLALTPIGAAIAGAIGNIAQYIVQMLVAGKGQCINVADLLFSGVMGAIGGAVGGKWTQGVFPKTALKFPGKFSAATMLGNEVREMAGQFKYVIDSAAKNFSAKAIGQNLGGDVIGNVPNPFGSVGAGCA